MSETTEMLYDLLSEQDRAHMVRNALKQLEERRFETELNQTILGDEILIGPENMHAKDKLKIIDDQIDKLRRAYHSLLDLYPPTA